MKNNKIDEAAMTNPHTKNQMKKLQRQSGASGASKKSSKDKSTTSALTKKIDTYGPKNESLLRDNTKKQMMNLKKTIDASGGDIESIVRKSSKSKEEKMPNVIYMDNPFGSKRQIDTWEHFSKNDANNKSTAAKSTNPKGKKMCSFSDFTCENVDNNVNEEMFLWGGNYVKGTYKVQKGTDGQDDNGKNYDIKKGDELTILDYDDKTKAYSVECNDKKYQLPYEIVEYLFDRKFRVEQKNENLVNESSRTDFMMNYRNELKQDMINLKKLSGVYEQATDEDFERIDKKMGTYDDNVGIKIDLWINDVDDVTIDDIVNFAINNQNEFGTEPQFVLFAIEDYVNVLNKYIVDESLVNENLNPNVYVNDYKCSPNELTPEQKKRQLMYKNIMKGKEDEEEIDENEEEINESKKSEEKHITTSIDNWIQDLDPDIKGTANDKLRPMFVNRPNNEIRPSYDINRAGKYVEVNGITGQVVGLKNGMVLVDIINKDTNKHEIVEMTMKEIIKSDKKKKKD